MDNPGLSTGFFEVLEKLGPVPSETLEVFADLGMSDAEVARYLRITPFDIMHVRALAKASGDSSGHAGHLQDQRWALPSPLVLSGLHEKGLQST